MLQDSLFAPRPPWILEGLRALVRHRFLTVRQLAALLGHPAEHVGESLAGFATEGLLSRLAAPADPFAHAYGLRAPALALLARAGHEVSPRERPRPRTLHTLVHDLAVNELAVVLERLHVRGALALLDWQTARERLADVAHLNERGRAVRVPLVADALAVIATDHARVGLLIEVDRGTVSIARMRRKFAGYFSWWQDGGPVRRFGLAATRVLTLTNTRRRLGQLRTLARDAAAPRGTGLFWFAPLEAVDVEAPERFLDPVALVAREGEDTPRTILATGAATP